MKQINIDLNNEINPHFEDVWYSEKPYNVLRGGRNSFKSSVIALKLVYDMLLYIRQGEKVNAVIVRKVANTIRHSVFLKIQWAIEKFGILDEFTSTVSPFVIKHKGTGSSFYFYGSDDFERLKSNDIGDLIAVWYEESAEFENQEEFDQTNVTFMRQKHELAPFVQVFWSYNPPRNPYSWINEWSDGLVGEDDYLVHDSSYKDDELGFVTEQMLADINRIKRNDFDYYRYLYLGEPVGLGTNVFNMNLFKGLDELPSDDRIIGLYYSIDGGHSMSATTFLFFGLTAKRNVILLNTYYYSPLGVVNKKAPSDYSKDLNTFIRLTSTQQHWQNARIQNRTIDSAEAAIRNQYRKDFGQELSPVKKLKKVDMVDYVHVLLAQGRFYYLKKPYRIDMKNTNDNDIFIEEHKHYQADEKTIGTKDIKFIEEDDHTVDAFIYFCLDNARDLQLKV